MKKLIHKLLCLIRLHKFIHSYSMITESTVTVVCKCIYCNKLEHQTFPRFSTSG